MLGIVDSLCECYACGNGASFRVKFVGIGKAGLKE